MSLPQDKGTYILIARVSQMKRLAIGSLGEFDIIPGFYAYVGSAFGSGGLCRNKASQPLLGRLHANRRSGLWRKPNAHRPGNPHGAKEFPSGRFARSREIKENLTVCSCTGR
jgi:hypothetical protein